MERSFGLLFYLKKRTGCMESELPVYIRITIDGKSKELSTKRKCNPKIWNTDAGRIFKKYEEAIELMLTWILFNKRFLKPSVN